MDVTWNMVREARSNLEFLTDMLTRLKGTSQGTVIVLELEDAVVGSYKTREEAEQAIKKARGVLGDARVDEILAEKAVRKAQPLVDKAAISPHTLSESQT